MTVLNKKAADRRLDASKLWPAVTVAEIFGDPKRQSVSEGHFCTDRSLTLALWVTECCCAKDWGVHGKVPEVPRFETLIVVGFESRRPTSGPDLIYHVRLVARLVSLEENFMSRFCLRRSFGLFAFALLVPVLSCVSPGIAWADKPADKPADSADSVNVLLITSGCCHDYDFQTKMMQLAFEQRGVKAAWTVVNDGGKGTSAEIDFYNSADWAKGFDVVIHNECFAKTTNPEYIRKITRPHFDGTNGVVIHCAMHTYRDATIDDWRKFLGVTSRRHEHQSNYTVKVTAKDHPVMAGYPDGHKTAKDELYVIEKTWPNTTVLATSKSEKTDKEHPVFWTNTYGKARVFGTTYGHSNETFEDKAFLDALTNGTLWAAGKLKVAK